MLFCAFVCTAWAAPTDFPVMSEGENIKWYTLSNTRSTSGKYLYWTEGGVKDSNERTAASFFYFTGTADECYIHNYSTKLLFSGDGAWTDAGVACKLSVSPLGTGIMIGFNETFLNEQNHANGYTTWSDVNDAGSIFVAEEITDFSAVIDVPAAKEAAIAELTNLATVSTIYPAATTAIAAVNAVPADDKSLAGLNTAVEAVNKVVADYKVAAYQALAGKYFTINTPARSGNGYMKASGATVIGSATAVSPENIWQFEYNDGAVSVYNPYTGLYLGTPGGNSSNIALGSETAKYDLVVNAGAENENAKVKLTCDGKSVHMAGGGTLVRWDNGGASEWTVTEVTNFSTLISAYKTSTISTLDSWATLSVVFDATLIATAKTNINAINTTDFATFAALDAELTNVTDAVATKMFTFQTLATDAHRENVWVSANASTGKAIGAHTATPDYNAIWSLRHAGGVSFYIYNELTSKYMGKPSGNATLTDAPVDAYTFEIIDAANGVVEFKCGGETLHASNHTDDKLLSWDGDEAASRWYIRTIDIAADIQAILDGLTADDYAEVPALGQYPKAAYDALVEARSTAKTVEEVETAIATFKKSKNLPVFTISGTKDYVVGKSIYDDNSGSLYFKTTNKFDKSMWWAFDQTTSTVGVTDEVVVTNYATGKNFWGATSVKITETSEDVADDGIFLLYTTGNGTPVHFQNDNSIIVRWNSTEANSGSAMTFTFVGTTQELSKLTDEHIVALTNLKTVATANVKYLNAVIGAELGQYNAGNKDAIVAAITEAQAIDALSVGAVATMDVADITAVASAITESAATFAINMPTAGFYRVKSMNGNDDAKKGKYIESDGGHLALNAEAGVNSIMYLDGSNNLVSYALGVYLNKYNDPEAKGAEGSAWVITENAEVIGAYTLDNPADTQGGPQYFLSDWTGGVTYGNDDANAAWMLEEVTAIPVTISAAGYATLYAPVALALPEGLIAYEVTAQGEESVSLTQVNDIIPAYNGVVLQGEANTTYNLTIPEYVPVAGSENLLEGSVAATFVESPAYVLGYVGEEGSKEVGFYTAAMNQNEGTAFLNNGFKAYLPKTGAAQALRFNFGGTTAIESVVNGINANAAIYDLSGRRVEKATKGIYIVNGKKMIVK